MEIDLFTVIAQIVNFIILLLLLKYLLYGRIIKAMDKREEMIASRIREAEEEKAKAEDRHRSLTAQQEELAAEREQKLRQAASEAELKKKEMLAAARQEAAESRERWLESLSRQKESFLRDLRIRSGQEVYSAARKTLEDLADADLEGQIVSTFVARFGELEDGAAEEIAELFRGSGSEVAVRSSFEMTRKLKEKVQGALGKRLGKKNLNLSFETSPEIVCGIELRAGDRIISWNLDNYLSVLEDRVSSLLEEEGAIEGRAGTEAVTE